MFNSLLLHSALKIEDTNREKFQLQNKSQGKFTNYLEKAMERQYNSITEALSSLPHFSLFQELIEIPQSKHKLLQHEVVKITKNIADIHDYLYQLQQQFITFQESKQPLEWFNGGKNEITQLLNDAETIDSIISQLLTVIDDGAESFNPDHLDRLLAQFEQTSDLLLDLKKQFVILKKKIDISINYEEITCNIMNSLKSEILVCGESFQKILNSKISSPKRHLPKFNLAEITNKMKINDMTISSNPNFDFSIETLRLPTFNDTDECLYNDYLSLDARMKPLKVSLDFLPLKIAEFNHLAGNFFPQAVSHVQQNYGTLIEAWDGLQVELHVLKCESVDTKWVEIFSYLVSEISSKCDEIHGQLKHAKTEDEKLTIVDTIGSSYKLCSNTITIISKAFSQGTIVDHTLAEKFNETLLPKWESLNSTLLNTSTSPTNFRHSFNDKIVDCPSRDSIFDDLGLKVFQTTKRRSADRYSLPLLALESNPRSSFTKLHSSKHSISSQGFDIGISINPMMSENPFSIKQKKVIDYLPNVRKSDITLEMSRKSLSLSLMKLNGETRNEEDEDDSKTLVHATPQNKKEPRDSMSRSTLVRATFSKQELFNYLMLNHTQQPTRLPLIREDYGKLGLPVIKKKLDSQPTISSIPTISPNHPVFQSPIRDVVPQEKPAEKLQPPAFALRRNSLLKKDSQIVVQKRRQPLAPSTKYNSRSTISRMSSLALTDTNTPNLAYNTKEKLALGSPRPARMRSASSSIRSTSPERPDSSMGSRFDEVHLIQPVKTKSAWR